MKIDRLFVDVIMCYLLLFTSLRTGAYLQAGICIVSGFVWVYLAITTVETILNFQTRLS